MTTLAEERREQLRWKARLKYARPVYDILVSNEFDGEDERRKRFSEALAGLLRFAAKQVPYYAEMFRRVGANAETDDPVATLAALPILTKLDVHDFEGALLAHALPPHERIEYWTKSSGTTGRPTRAPQSTSAMRWFTWLKQREYRWFRLDPSGSFATIRMAEHLPDNASNKPNADGETLSLPGWPYMQNFATGAFLGFNATNALEEQIAWLRRTRPDYLLSYSETLEHLAFAAAAEPPCGSLKALIAVAEQVTPGMRAHIEDTFRAPLHQNYGLNEIGLVAARCEAGRYHVHEEHCHVEILAMDGRAAASGESGRIVVTGLSNRAMPLLRYDTGDLAHALEGPCPCGRTLASFGEITGRYSRIAFLPEGTLALVGKLRRAIETMPHDLVRDLRQFQIHQFRDNRFELRVATRAELPAGFDAHLRDCWSKPSAKREPVLTIIRVSEIARAPGGKFQVFTSDFFPNSGTVDAPPP